jgi:hypothetical protein
MQNFGKLLERATRIAFPCHGQSRYSNVHVLMFSWACEDWRLPVNSEIAGLRDVLENVYHYKVGEFKIPDQKSHKKVSAKIDEFIDINDDNPMDLKIVYYAGHARLSKAKDVVWARYVAAFTSRKASCLIKSQTLTLSKLLGHRRQMRHATP